MENAFLKNFYIWDKIKGRLTPESVIFLEFVKEWCRSFPEDKQEILRLFVMTTVGKTAANDLGRTYEAMSYRGMIGNYQKIPRTGRPIQRGGFFTSLDQAIDCGFVLE